MLVLDRWLLAVYLFCCEWYRDTPWAMQNIYWSKLIWRSRTQLLCLPAARSIDHHAWRCEWKDNIAEFIATIIQFMYVRFDTYFNMFDTYSLSILPYHWGLFNQQLWGHCMDNCIVCFLRYVTINPYHQLLLIWSINVSIHSWFSVGMIHDTWAKRSAGLRTIC